MLIKNAKCWDVVKREYFKTDIRISNGKIVRMASGQPVYQDTEYYNLDGKFVYPSFIDSHMHLLGVGETLVNPVLNEVKSKEELSEIIKNIEEEIIVLNGWNEDVLGFCPDRKYLDEIINDRPVVLIRRCYHMASVNTKAVEYFKLDKYDGVDETDIENGFIKENVLSVIHSGMPDMKLKRIKELLSVSANHLKSYGISSVHSDDFHSMSFEDLMKFGKENTEIRIFEKINPGNHKKIDKFLENYARDFDDYSEFWSMKSLKLFMDGSLGARTAFLTSPYVGDTENYGVPLMSEAELTGIIKKAQKKKIAVMIHCIGDAALEICLNAFEKTIESGNPLRHRLIHVQMASEKQLERIKKLGLYLSVQPVFYDSDFKLASEILGEERLREIGYPFDKMNEMDIEFSLSTDAPVEHINPFINLSSTMRFMPLEEAFYRYTYSAAKAEGSEKFKGKIAEGCFADMFVSDRDLFSLNTEELRDFIPEKVLFDGKWFEKPE